MHYFKKTLIMELKKAFYNRFFVIGLLSGISFAVVSGVSSVRNYYDTREALSLIGGNPMTEAFGLYNSWLGGESISIGFTLFFIFLPLLAVIPYGWSYQMEEKSGYRKLVVSKCGRRSCLFAKYIAAFAAGGAAVVIPLALNFIAVACFIPAVHPSIVYEIYYPMRHGAIWSELFYTKPLLFVMLYLLLDFVFGGLFAVIGMAVSFYSKNRLTVVLAPFIIAVGLQYASTFLYPVFHKEVSPVSFLHAVTVQNYADGRVIFVEGIFAFLLTFFIVFLKGHRREDF